jgi:glucose/arabinose dehydrogenase
MNIPSPIKHCLHALLLLGVISNILLPSRATTASQPTIAWPKISLITYQSGFSSPVHLANAGDGSQRLFVVEQRGIIRIIKNNVVLNTPFLDIQDRVLFPGSGERGLLSVAFPSDYATKGYFYVYYTRLDGNNQTSRFHLKPGKPDEADPFSEQLIILFNHPNYSNHNGGQLAFGPDGYLYIGTGDGGGGGDPQGNAQNPASLLGKLLRIDVESGVDPYLVPVTNPYTQTVGYRGEIWALGLRNPWRYAFDRQTGDLYIGDVGQNTEEEVDFQPASSQGGENYGWNVLEGNLCYIPSVNCIPPSHYEPPIAVYDHGVNDSNGCAITGGGVYRGATYLRMQGIYFYGDYCSGKIWGLLYSNGWQSQPLLDTDLSISTFGEDEAGNLYLADLSSGRILQIVDWLTAPVDIVYLPVASTQ